eukprot:3381437-Pyramimonas_sp.AAC.1
MLPPNHSEAPPSQPSVHTTQCQYYPTNSLILSNKCVDIVAQVRSPSERGPTMTEVLNGHRGSVAPGSKPSTAQPQPNPVAAIAAKPSAAQIVAKWEVNPLKMTLPNPNQGGPAGGMGTPTGSSPTQSQQAMEVRANAQPPSEMNK